MTLPLLILTATILITFAITYFKTRKRILKPDDPNRPFTSDELESFGIKLAEPTRYDIETFIR